MTADFTGATHLRHRRDALVGASQVVLTIQAVEQRPPLTRWAVVSAFAPDPQRIADRAHPGRS